MIHSPLILPAFVQHDPDSFFPGVFIYLQSKLAQFLPHPFVQQLINIPIVGVKRITVNAAALRQSGNADLVKRHFR
jgi:hypothetical protein